MLYRGLVWQERSSTHCFCPVDLACMCRDDAAAVSERHKVCCRLATHAIFLGFELWRRTAVVSAAPHYLQLDSAALSLRHKYREQVNQLVPHCCVFCWCCSWVVLSSRQ
jgi:hypothetical protein